MNGVTTAPLSPIRARWNWNWGEDAL